MLQDCREKRARMIDSSVKIRESFSFAHPTEQILAVTKYCSAAYGSNLWDLGSREAQMFPNAWRTGHKLAWDVPRSCHTFLVQEGTGLGEAALCSAPGSLRWRQDRREETGGSY